MHHFTKFIEPSYFHTLPASVSPPRFYISNLSFDDQSDDAWLYVAFSCTLLFISCPNSGLVFKCLSSPATCLQQHQQERPLSLQKEMFWFLQISQPKSRRTFHSHLQNFEILKTEIVRVIILAGGESRHGYQIEIWDFTRRRLFRLETGLASVCDRRVIAPLT